MFNATSPSDRSPCINKGNALYLSFAKMISVNVLFNLFLEVYMQPFLFP